MPNKKAVIETKKGTIEVELFADEVPSTVANFEKLANSSFYDGTKFHRVISNFMIKDGDPYSKTGKGPVRTGGPGYTNKSATQLRGEYVIRTPRSLHRIYTMDLNPDGTVRRLQLVTHNIGGGPGPMETKNSVDFSGDSAVLVSPRGDSSVTTKMAVPKGTFPFQLHVYGLLEQMGRWARAQGKDSVRFSALTSATATSGGY